LRAGINERFNPFIGGGRKCIQIVITGMLSQMDARELPGRALVADWSKHAT